MLSPQARKLLQIPKQAQLPTELNQLYDHWIAGRGYETRFGTGWRFMSRSSARDGSMPYQQAAYAAGFTICLEHRTAQSWFSLDSDFRVFVECEDWVQIASSFLNLIEEDASLVASNAKGDARRGLGEFPSFEEFWAEHGDYLSSFEAIGRDQGLGRMFRGPKSVVTISRFHSDEFSLTGIEYY